MTTPAELLFDGRFEHPEGLVWDVARRRLVWVDIRRGELHIYEPHSDGLRTIELGAPVGSVAPRRAGGFVCALGRGFALVSEAGEVSMVVPDLLGDEPPLHMNDGAVDGRGRFWAGSASAEPHTHPGVAALYRLEPSGAVTEVFEGVTISNGIGWSPDATRCYYVDSATRRLDEFDFDLEEGHIANRRPLASFDAYPDGLAVDVEGCIWVAVFGGSEVRRLTPAGVLDSVVRLPGRQVTTCAFGGDDHRTLFVAVSALGLRRRERKAQKAGSIFALDPGVEGLPPVAFLG